MQIEFMVAALRILAAVLVVAALWPRALRPSQWTLSWPRQLGWSRQNSSDRRTLVSRPSGKKDQRTTCL